MKTRHLLATTTVLATLAFTSAAQAATVAVSNLHTEDSAAFQSIYDPGAVYTSLATSFTTGSGPGWGLSSATFDLDRINASTDFLAYIFPDTSGKPGTSSLATSLATVGGATRSDVTFDFSSSVLTLNPTTTYWLAITTLGSQGAAWAHPDTSSTTTGLSSWTIGNELVSYSPSTTSWGSEVAQPGLFSIEVTPIPEPGSLVAVGCFLAAGLTIRKRRQSA